MVVFRPKIGQFSKFFKILSEIDKTHRNTHLVQKSAHLKHFWPFYGHLKAHFGPIFLIYKVQQNRLFLPNLYSRLLKLLENGRFQYIAHYISKRRGGNPLRDRSKISKSWLPPPPPPRGLNKLLQTWQPTRTIDCQKVL